MDEGAGAEHINTGDVQGISLFYEGGQAIKDQEGSLGSLASNEALMLEREYLLKTEQGRLYDAGLLESRGLFTSLQLDSKRLKMQQQASENHGQQELLLGPSFNQYAVLNHHEGPSSNNALRLSSLEGTSSTNVRSSLVVESSKEHSFFNRPHVSANSILHASNANNIPIALPLLSSSCKNDPPLLQDLPWFANHALEEEEVAAAAAGQAGFPLVRPTAANFSSVSLHAHPSITNCSSFSSANAHARSSLISLLGENDAEQSVMQAHIAAHPLFEQMLGAHLACLRVGTPPERWPDAHSLDARLALSRQELDAKYLLLARNAPPPHDKDNLDHFMLSFTLLLQTFREQLREHMQVHSVEASSGCAEIKDAFLRLTGEMSLNNAACSSTMSEDEDMMDDEGEELHHQDHMHVHDASMCSPFNMASEIDKSLMENVRKELKHELKQNYRTKLWDVREEIMRKRRAGKLPGSTTSLLKDWWDAHSKWPYPTEEEKMKLVQETGLELKQINNWFINQRKRNWSSNPAYERAEMDELSLYGVLHPSC